MAGLFTTDYAAVIVSNEGKTGYEPAVWQGFVPIEISMLLTVGGSNSRYDTAKNLIKPVFTHEKYCNAMWMHRKLELEAVSFTAIKQKNRFSETGFSYQVPCLSELPADSSVLGSFRPIPTFAPADPLLSRRSS